jgi:transcriptional regulator with XRE-family HTH domain
MDAASLLPAAPARRPRAGEPLWREVLGRRLRAERLRRRLTLAQAARRAGVSPQYLSEVERGMKEASSEMVAAIAGALGLALVDLTAAVTTDLGGPGATAGPGRAAGAPRSQVLALAA